MKVDPDEQAKNGETALIRSVHFNDIKMVKLLLDHGASIELRYVVKCFIFNRTMQDVGAVITAITRHKPKILDLLLRYGA